MKNPNKLEIIQDVFEKHLGSRIKELERSYNKHTANLELCFNNIEYMKNIKKICENILEESNNSCDKSFISVFTNKSNINSSKISENKALYDRKKTPMRSYAKVDNESKSTVKNREELLKKNLSKPKSRNSSNTRANAALVNNNQTIKTMKSNSSIRNVNKSLKPDRGVSEDHNKELNKTPIPKKRTEDRVAKNSFMNIPKETNQNNNTLKKNPSMKRLSTDFRNVTPGKSRVSNTTQGTIPPNGKTPNKNILNISQVKKPQHQQQGGEIETVNLSGLNLSKDKTNKTTDVKNLKRLNSKKLLSSTNTIQKGTIGNVKQKNALNNTSNSNFYNNNNNNLNNYNIKKVNNKGDESIANYAVTESNDGYNLNNNDGKEKKKSKVYQISKNDLLEVEKELNVSNLIQMESNISDDLLLYNNKDDQFLSIKGLNFMSKFKIIDSTPQIKHNPMKLDAEDILDDKWDNYSIFLSLKEIAAFSLINKKIGKNAIIFMIDELEKEKLFFEEKVLSTSFSEDQSLREDVSFSKELFELSKPSKKAISLLNDSVLNKMFNEPKTIPCSDILFIYRLYFQLINHEVCQRNLSIAQFWGFVCNFIIKEGAGKTGNLISTRLEQQLDTSAKNLFKINRLIRNNQHKLNPTYFSDICGTSGLVTFFLKDSLEYLGAISTKNTCQTRILKNAVLISDYLNNKIENLRNMLEKIYNY